VNDTSPRRVFRSRDDRVIAGVGGGLGHYLGIDPVLVRIAFVALAVAGVGVLLYIVAWIAIPEAPASGEAPVRPESSSGPSGSQLIIGSLLVMLGVLFLIDWVIPVRRLLVPLAIIAVGIAIIATGRRGS
jgi:phage shock protein C